jgi:hypothetical protein
MLPLLPAKPACSNASKVNELNAVPLGTVTVAWRSVPSKISLPAFVHTNADARADRD